MRLGVCPTFYVKNILQWDRRRASRLSGRLMASGGSLIARLTSVRQLSTNLCATFHSIAGAKTASSCQLAAVAAIPVAGASAALTARQETYMDQNNSFLLFPQKRTTNRACA